MPIHECGEALAPIPADIFAFFEPHPYAALGAPYNGESPWRLRQGVVKALQQAQVDLQSQRPGWKIQIFDAYRPNRVQAFMVEREFRLLAKAQGWDGAALTMEQRELLAPKVFRLWSIPSEDPKTPPLHSTGGAVDCTLIDQRGAEVDMGSALDENSDRSYPDYFADSTDPKERQAHHNRRLLAGVMTKAAFTLHHAEWWHFSLGDQYAAWRRREAGTDRQALAIYGRADLL